MYKEISSSELIELMRQQKINLLDIRTKYEYLYGTINGSKNIPSDVILTNPSNYLNKDEVYYIFCNYGNNSKMLSDYLSRLGYKVVNIKDGYYGYLDSIN